MKHKNFSAERRVWSGIQAPDGSTLELGPGEEVDLPRRVKDPVLRPTKLTKKEKDAQAKQEAKEEQEAKEKEEQDAAAAAEGDTTDTEEQK